MYFIVFRDREGEWRWRLRAANHKTIVVSEGYVAKASALHSIRLVKQTWSMTPVQEEEE